MSSVSVCFNLYAQRQQAVDSELAEIKTWCRTCCQPGVPPQCPGYYSRGPTLARVARKSAHRSAGPGAAEPLQARRGTPVTWPKRVCASFSAGLHKFTGRTFKYLSKKTVVKTKTNLKTWPKTWPIILSITRPIILNNVIYYDWRD